jgi:tellurite resistance protein TehA-like permease
MTAPGRASAWLADLHPASFAVVMATGIVSIACQLHGIVSLAVGLFWANVILYAALWVLTAARLAWHRDRVVTDLWHHGRAVGFFTVVAATCVLGSQALLITSAPRVAAALWVVGIGLWAGTTYTVFTVVTVKADKPSLAEGINGGWLVPVVAGQSVAVLGAQLAPTFGVYAGDALLFALVMWLGAGMLYIWIISLIFYRYTFFVLSPSDLAPPYWINMGAVAISTLAGATLAGASSHSPLVTELLPFIKGLTLFFWATATWWIPMLIILGIWRHVYRRVPIRYDPLYWGAVFPLGMYSVCTFRLAPLINAPSLLIIPRIFLFAALAAWSFAMAGLLRQLLALPQTPLLRDSTPDT